MHDKFGASGFTADASHVVQAPRVRECPVQMESAVEAVHGIADDDPRLRGHLLTFEVRVLRVHLHESILMDGQADRVDPGKWRPLIMSFQKFHGLGRDPLHDSSLATIPEAMDRSPDVDRARQAFTP